MGSVCDDEGFGVTNSEWPIYIVDCSSKLGSGSSVSASASFFSDVCDILWTI